MSARDQKRRWGILCLGVLALLFAGVLYAWSILKAPLVEAFGWSAGQLALNFTVSCCFFCLGGVAGSRLSARRSPRVTLLLAALLVGGGFALASRLDGSSLAALYISYGVLCGAGIGMAYNAVISTVSGYFPDKPGLCSGALMMAFGLSSLLLGGAANRLMAQLGWRGVYLGLGLSTALALLLAAVWLRRCGDGAAPAAADPADTGCTSAEMVKKPAFYCLFLYLICCSMVGNSVLSFARDYALSLGAAASAATSMVGLCSVCNGLGRILCGLAYDALGRRRTMLLASLLNLAAPLAALAASLLRAPAAGAAALCLVGLSYGCCPTLTAAGTLSLFGRRHYAANYSLMNMNLLPASFTAAAAGALIERGGYPAAFGMLALAAALALLLNFALQKTFGGR